MKIFTCRVKHGVQYGWGLQVGGCPCPTLSLCTTEGNAASLGKYLHPKHEIVMSSVHKDQTVYDSAVPYYRGWPDVLGPGSPSKTSTDEWLAKVPEVIDGRTVFKPDSGSFMPPGAEWKKGKETCVQATEPIVYPKPVESPATVPAAAFFETPLSVPIESPKLSLAERARLRKEGALS